MTDPQPVWCALCGNVKPRDTKTRCGKCGCMAYTTRKPDQE